MKRTRRPSSASCRAGRGPFAAGAAGGAGVGNGGDRGELIRQVAKLPQAVDRAASAAGARQILAASSNVVRLSNLTADKPARAAGGWIRSVTTRVPTPRVPTPRPKAPTAGGS